MAKKKVTFETAIAGLEEVTEALENDNISLDRALKTFEKGIGFMRSCDSELKKAEGKLKELLEGDDGKLVEEVLGISSEMLNSDGEF